MRFETGQVVLRRYFQRAGTLSVVQYGRVVADDDRGLRLWIGDGSPLRWRGTADGRSLRDLPFSEWIHTPQRLHEGVWEGHGILVLIPPGAAHTVWWFWRPGDVFAGWYVNLEQPAVRWRDGQLAGVDTVDQDLDIVAEPDGSWAWKDEHEVAERSAYPGHYWVDDPGAVRAEGEQVVKLIEARVFPFDGSWCEFRPDPSWAAPPDLPAGWDRPRARA